MHDAINEMGSTQADAIGGYFGLELGSLRVPRSKWIRGVPLNSGRRAFEYTLRNRPECKCVHVPTYICQAILGPIGRLGLDVRFYGVDSAFRPQLPSSIREDECLLGVNYFGICDDVMVAMAEEYPNQLIIDASHAFYFSTDCELPVFNSARKFFGVPDGGFAIDAGLVDDDLSVDESHGRCGHLLLRLDKNAEAGYAQFTANEKEMHLAPLRAMSQLTMALLSRIDMDECARRRRNNYLLLHGSLSEVNEINPILQDGAVPMVYPLLIENGLKCREYLRQMRIYCAAYWPTLACSESIGIVEQRLCADLLALPIDQRYSDVEMKEIIDALDAWRRIA